MLQHEIQLEKKPAPLLYLGLSSSQHDALWHGRPLLSVDHLTLR